MGFLLLATRNENLRRRAVRLGQRVWGEVFTAGQEAEPLLVMRSVDRRKSFAASPAVFGHVVGFVRHYGLPAEATLQQHNLTLLQRMLRGEWPLGDDFGGSFCAVAYGRESRTVAAATDLVGFYPLYLCRARDMAIVSSSLLLVAALSEQPVDPVGIRQRLTAPRYCNFGRRTIVANVDRLLPGECLSFSVEAPDPARRRYDNSLYRGLTRVPLSQAVQQLWEVIRRDVALALKFDQEVIVGQSGGMDSRLLLGALDPDKSVRCFAYGEPEHYETEIARRCAESWGAAFESFPTDAYQFPDRAKFEDYVLTTEAVAIHHWRAILERVKSEPETPFLIGDLCEAIPGRNIVSHARRPARVRNLARHVLLRQDPSFTPATDRKFRHWVEAQIKGTLQSAARVDPAIAGGADGAIDEAYESDLREICERIRQNDPPYVELYDEPFSWYTNGRMTMGKQLLLLQRSFFAVTPISSLKILRATCAVDPRLRIGYRLMDGLFRQVEALRELSRIPTAQIPLVRHSMPNWIKLPAWGLRVAADRMLQKRLVAHRNPDLRYSVFPTTNWARIYRQPGAVATVRSWLDPDRVGGARFVDLAERRRRLESRPLATKDITLVSGLNQELLLIEKLRAECR